MEINNSFSVPLPPRDAWALLLDIERIAPCMPGAEITGVVDKDTYNGKVSVRLGPVALAFAGQVKFTEIDNANFRARAKGQGKDTKGRGGANATVDFHLLPEGTGSQVFVKTDVMLSGAVAQYGRASGIIQDVATQLIGQFAACLKQQLEATRPAPTVDHLAETVRTPQSEAPKSKPISGFTLGLTVLWNAIKRLFGGK